MCESAYGTWGLRARRDGWRRDAQAKKGTGKKGGKAPKEASAKKPAEKPAAADSAAESELTTAQEEFDAITDKIPVKPVGAVEGTSYGLVILAALAVALGSAYYVRPPFFPSLPPSTSPRRRPSFGPNPTDDECECPYSNSLQSSNRYRSIRWCVSFTRPQLPRRCPAAPPGKTFPSLTRESRARTSCILTTRTAISGKGARGRAPGR